MLKGKKQEDYKNNGKISLEEKERQIISKSNFKEIDWYKTKEWLYHREINEKANCPICKLEGKEGTFVI